MSAGYVFAVSKDGWNSFVENNLQKGFFVPRNIKISDEMTSRKMSVSYKILSSVFGDLITMKAGDNVYFLSDRKIYGVGELINIKNDCKYEMISNSSGLEFDDRYNKKMLLIEGDEVERWGVFFEPSPYFFVKGADMDDVLSYRPYAFRTLRAFEGLSFIKIDEEENRALKEYISLINENSYASIKTTTYRFSPEIHKSAKRKDLSGFRLDIGKAYDCHKDTKFFSEMYLEATLLQALQNKEYEEIFGKWDYLSHQVIASPFKPLTYVDKIDIFGMRFSDKYRDTPRLVTKYLIIELKKDKVNGKAIEQTMQYVDWVCREYASGDYSRVEAYVVGNGAVRTISHTLHENCQRYYISETHPVVTRKWNNLKIVTYNYNEKKKRIEFSKEEC